MDKHVIPLCVCGGGGGVGGGGCRGVCVYMCLFDFFL